MRQRARGELLLAAVVVVIGVAAAAFTLGGSAGAPGRPSTSARPTALAFARGYLAYLDGRASSSELASATARVVATAAAAGVIPAGDRAGEVTLRRLAFEGVQGAPRATAVLTGADRSRSLQAALGLSYLDGRWQVSSLVPPDLSTLLAPRPAPTRAAPALQRAAASFTLEYADYREHAGPRPSNARGLILHQIATAQDPLAGLAATGVRVSLRSLQVLPEGSLATVAAVASDRGRRIGFGFILQRTGGSWRPWQFPAGAR